MIYSTHECHYIPTKDPPICVPPRCIPGHYQDEVIQQLELMLSQGVIKESSSPWMAPTVFVLKKSGELRICVDYRALNKQSVKHSYPLPPPHKIQDCLTNATVFSTLDLHSRYWQLPVAERTRPKQHSAQDLEWVSISSAVCHLVYQEHQDPFSN